MGSVSCFFIIAVYLCLKGVIIRSAAQSKGGVQCMECSFKKLHDRTALKVSYQGNIRVWTNGGCCRWFFKFNDYECSGPMTIDSVLYNGWPSGNPNIHRHHSIEGYCENLPRGTVHVELWVGKCRTGPRLGNAYTGHSSVSRIMIEEVPPSQ